MKVCIFCGARSGLSTEILEAVTTLCELLIKANCQLVYGGGRTGIMGLIADQFLEHDQHVIGIRPRSLIKEEAFHTGLSELIIVDSMQERKARMVEESDCFIALPGGVGTLDEIIETFTLYKLDITNKPSGIFNVKGFYNGLDQLLQRMVADDFLKEQDRRTLPMSDDPHHLLDLMGIKSSVEE